ncbi:TrmA family RNA methyltransferase [Echinococcus multilocularis]|uniref:TrmA family RNA methyltransferase n=1 Tax=Echinococcus multilocularis TaxID=6211 RepID=A0A0S4MJH7_ECHMU|nr:TrmA family RNA methyltransferase [Echinococcus multilocularis]
MLQWKVAVARKEQVEEAGNPNYPPRKRESISCSGAQRSADWLMQGAYISGQASERVGGGTSERASGTATSLNRCCEASY